MLAIRQRISNPEEIAAETDWTQCHDPENRKALALDGAQATTDHGPATSYVAIIDHRVLGREVLTTAFAAEEGSFNSRAYADTGEWRIDKNRHRTSAILIVIGGVRSGDPELSADLRSLTREHPQIPVVVMGDSEVPSEVLEILFHGARGYIPTSASLSVAIGALSLAVAGGVFVPTSALLTAGYARQQPHPDATGIFGLTERQAEVAEGIAHGKPNKVIAYELNLSESTIKVHIRGIMRKLQARNRTEVAFKLHASKDRPSY
ncbi:MAG: LuxR C-terminal-related transcriptional regulator [Inquilinus sp.]|uniref:LuxR C-terminal-related transcriptional regulator n=1 Tax=Inquilinus sp. TaxID=1932117 RepID=UPI003F3448FD